LPNSIYLDKQKNMHKNYNIPNTIYNPSKFM